jgi:hypothetical protein
MLFNIPDERNSPNAIVAPKNPGLPRRGFSLALLACAALTAGLCVGDREARADCQSGELIDRIAAGAPVR